MKNFVLLLIFVLIFYKSNGQNKKDSLGHKTGLWVFTELPYETFMNIEPIVLATYVNDTLEGSFKVLDSNEVLRYECIYYKNLKNGVAINYFSNGKVKNIYQYSNGIILSQITLDGKGKIYELVEYKNGKKDGYNLVFYKNGKISKKDIYINNTIVEEIIYFSNGNPRARFSFDEGKFKDCIKYTRRGKVIKQ